MGSSQSKEDKRHISNYQDYLNLAEIYHAYQYVSKYIDDSARDLVLLPFFIE